MTKFKYLDTTVVNQSYSHEWNKRRLNSGDVCYYSFHELFPFRPLYKNIDYIKTEFYLLLYMGVKFGLSP
jgi:hypothetical protein